MEKQVKKWSSKTGVSPPNTAEQANRTKPEGSLISFPANMMEEDKSLDRKWCAASSQTGDGKSKRIKLDDASQTSGQSSSSYTATASNGDEGESRPTGVKAAKGKAKKTSKKEGKALKEFQSMWEIKKKDLELKQKLSKHKLLEILLAKTEPPLSDMEMALKNKLINDILNG